MVALFESLWVSYWQGGGMFLQDDSMATVSGSSYTSCSAGHVSGCTWGPLQPGNVAHVKVWAMAHTSTLLSSPLLHSPTHPTPTHVAGCSLCVLLVTMVHPFDPLLHGQSIQHGHHGGGPHLVPPWPPTPLALYHELQYVRIGVGMTSCQPRNHTPLSGPTRTYRTCPRHP